MALVGNRSYTFDINMLLKDAGLVAASAAAQVSAAAKVIDLGGADPFFAVVVIDASAIEVDTGDEKYELMIQGSNSSTFAGAVSAVLAQMTLGHATALASGLATTTPGRYELPFLNVQNGTIYRYLRMYTKIAGTIATGINYTAFLGEVPKAF